MRANPEADWTIKDVTAPCTRHGVLCAPRGAGSHDRVAHPRMLNKLTISSRPPIKPVYIRRLAAFIDAVESMT